MNVSIALGGFGSQGWGDAAWGEGNVSFVATGSIGSVTVLAGANVPVSGLQALGQVGSVSIGIGTNVSLVGVSGTASVTSLSVWITINDNQTPNWVQIAA